MQTITHFFARIDMFLQVPTVMSTKKFMSAIK